MFGVSRSGLASTFVLGSNLAISCSIAFVAGCSSPPEAERTGVATSSVASVQGGAASVQAFLDARYKQSDVQHSFHTIFGETIDCIDFFAQPGARALAAQGTPLTAPLPNVAPPSAMIALRATGASPAGAQAALFDGQPDENGNARACSGLTVPMLRITAADVATAGGLDAFVGLQQKKNGVSQPPDNAGPAYAHIQRNYTGGGTITAGDSYMGIFSPVVSHIPNHSLAQTWTWTNTSGVGAQTVEIGWSVDPGVYYLNNPTAPHLFIYATNNNYTSGCYNNLGSSCLTFLVPQGAVFTPGQTLTSGVVGGTQQDLGVFTVWQPQIGSTPPCWYVFVALNTGNTYPLGCYPASDFSGQMQTSASIFQAGGEVSDSTNGSWVVPMGIGSSPAAGFGQSAYMYGYEACTGTGSQETCNFSFTDPGPTENAYAESTSPAAPPQTPSGWPYFYYGMAPEAFWGQNWGSNFSPTNPLDWSWNNYKGECGPQVAITGVSRSASAIWTHGIQCGQGLIANNESGCYERNMYQYDNRGDNDNGWDWDPNNYKDECAANEFVQGIAQTQSGHLAGILCCPGNVTHQNCSAQVFYNGNSSAFTSSSPDWDLYYYKGQCTGSQYVAGISTPDDANVGAAHAVLCCSP